VQAESIFPPITDADIRRVKAQLALDGENAEAWSKRNGYSPKLVHQVLSGNRRCIRGRSLQIAIKLGLRADPTAPASADPPTLPAFQAPTGRTIGARPPIASCDRRSISQLGEALR
jgi:gp16 family phage-associated protein